MRRMKSNIRKFTTASAALFISLNSFAQFGITAGFTSPSAYVSESTTEVNSEATVNFHAGICYKAALGEGEEIFVLQPSLIYMVKGSKVSKPAKFEANYKTGSYICKIVCHENDKVADSC